LMKRTTATSPRYSSPTTSGPGIWVGTFVGHRRVLSHGHAQPSCRAEYGCLPLDGTRAGAGEAIRSAQGLCTHRLFLTSPAISLLLGEACGNCHDEISRDPRPCRYRDPGWRRRADCLWVPTPQQRISHAIIFPLTRSGTRRCRWRRRPAARQGSPAGARRSLKLPGGCARV